MVKKGIAAFVVFIAAIFMLPAQYFGAEKDITFIIEYEDFAGVEFDLYYVAKTEDFSHFTLTGDFEEYPVKVNGLDSEDYRKLANTLSGYVERDRLQPYDSGKTDKNGRLVFPNHAKSLKKGLYLIVGEKHTQGNYIYTPEPAMVFLPGIDPETGKEIDRVTAEPKYDKDKKPGDGGKDSVTRKVIKVWDDNGNKNKRPESITVQLLKDGKVYDTVKLNEGNNWRYTWKNLNPEYKWTVVEKEIKDYTVEIDREGITFIITNTYDSPDEPDKPEKPDEPNEPNHPDKPDQPNQPNRPDEPSRPDNPNHPDGPDHPEESLPQTGVLWWPVPLLTAAGLLLIAIGWLIHRGADREK